MEENHHAQAKIDEHFTLCQQQINEIRLTQSQQHEELVALIKQLQTRLQNPYLHRTTGEAIDEVPDCIMEDDNDEIFEDTSTENLGDKPAEISFPTLVGQQNPSTIHLTRVSPNHSLHVLIDDGSTHNFVKDQVAKIIKWPIVPPTPFRVLIGNGESLLCPKKCLDVKLNLQTPEFQFDLVLLPSKGAAVILGIQWLEELGAVLECSSAHKLFATLSKYQFCQNMLDYLGKLLSGLGLQSDPDTVQAMQHWTWPSSLKHLCGFLGLTGYYRQFIRHYATVASPLTDLLQKDAFPWSSEAQKAFAHSKKCLRTMFEALYGRKPPTIPSYNSGSSSIEAVEDDLPQRDQILIRLKYTLHQSQARMSCLGDLKRELMVLQPSSLIQAMSLARIYEQKYDDMKKSWKPPWTKPVGSGSDAFSWNPEAQSAFDSLKSLLTQVPVLASPDFSKEFVLETDASSIAIGAVLMQDKHPIAYFSKKMSPTMSLASAYVKELFAITEAVKKWRQYLLGQKFTIYTDHHSLKNLMAQVIPTPEQQQYLCKLLGYNYAIVYKSGKDNIAADALSRIEESLPDSKPHSSLSQLMALSSPIFDITSQLQLENNIDSELRAKRAEIEQGKASSAFSLRNGFILHNHRLFIGSNSPLPVPQQIWEDIAMDFINGLPPSNGFTVILVVIDRLSKYAHFGALPSSYTAVKVARLFTDIAVKLHGIPKTIVSGRDPIFTSKFWSEIWKLSGTTLTMSSAYQPQTDGQSVVLNRCHEQYLHAFSQDNPKHWQASLLWAEYSYNTSFHSAIKMTPYEAVYGRQPPTIPSYMQGSSRVEAADEELTQRDTILTRLKTNLIRAHSRMKSLADQKCTDKQLEVGSWVLLKLQSYRQLSVATRSSQKLSKRFYGPYEIESKVSNVAYKLKLPGGNRIHPVFQISLLKQYYGPTPNVVCDLPSPGVANQPLISPLGILSTRTILRDNKAVQQVPVQWTGLLPEDTSWEDIKSLQTDFPHLHLEDKVDFQGVGNDTLTEQPRNSTVSEQGYNRAARAKSKPHWMKDYVEN
ncbi:uncharacterized protein LOC143850075 [Tasmannia lanceolata]|uniref:uncharacterized protein LOC143850075 n=1 Tax=Tasmannia lanceolata TaxID=3420 RepID=UPI0040633289